MKEFLFFLLLCAVMSALGTWSFNRRQYRWSDQKLVLIAALPVPALLTVLSVFILVRALMASKAACGVDVCAMAEHVALVGLLWAAVGYGIGLGTATLATRRLRR
jgi:membrane associated rhomboid family serine protease